MALSDFLPKLPTLQRHNMCDQPFVLQQNIFKEHHPSLHVIPCHENALSEKVVLDFLRTVDDHIGLAPTYGSNCSLASLAFSSSSQVLLVTFSTKSQRGKKKNQRSFPGRDLLRDFILCDTNSARPKVAFKMDRLALALYLDFGLRICDAIDLLSVVIGAKRQSVAALSQALGGELSLHKANVVALFKHEERKTTPVENTALQAWSARHATMLTGMSASVDKVTKIHTNLLCVAVRSFTLNHVSCQLIYVLTAPGYSRENLSPCRSSCYVETYQGQKRR